MQASTCSGVGAHLQDFPLSELWNPTLQIHLDFISIVKFHFWRHHAGLAVVQPAESACLPALNRANPLACLALGRSHVVAWPRPRLKAFTLHVHPNSVITGLVCALGLVR